MVICALSICLDPYISFLTFFALDVHTALAPGSIALFHFPFRARESVFSLFEGNLPNPQILPQF